HYVRRIPLRKIHIFAAAAALILLPILGSASTLPFFAHGIGPFAVYPLSATLLEEHQALSFDSVAPFPLTSGQYMDRLDLDLLNTVGFPDAIIWSTFTLTDGA